METELGGLDDRPQVGDSVNMKRLLHDFSVRPQKERDSFTQITWCDSCYKADLGMFNPIEFEKNGKRFLEGICTRCGSKVISEIIDKNANGSDEDIIWPLHHQSKPALTRIPDKPAVTMTWSSFSRDGYYSLRTAGSASRKSLIVFCILLTICILAILTYLLYPVYLQGGF